MSIPIRLCLAIVAAIPKCTKQIVIQINVATTITQLRVEKYNHQVRYYDLAANDLGLITVPIDNFWGPNDGFFILSMKQPVDTFFVSNMGLHQRMMLRVEDSNETTSNYFVDQDIVYFCCEEILNQCLCQNLG